MAIRGNHHLCPQKFPPRYCQIQQYHQKLVSFIGLQSMWSPSNQPVSKRQTQTPTRPARVSPNTSQTASPLPRPPSTLTRSYSIPSNSQRIPIITVNRLLECRQSREGSDISSPTLTPLSLADLSHHQAAKTTSNTRIKGK
jgi:hypothetical protein